MHDKSTPVPLPDIEAYFSEDYFHFSDVINPPEASDRQARAIWKILSLAQGSRSRALDAVMGG
ncbi:hypothetical protein [Mesorhizobium sp. M0254]|uniref:hypothetical protein n=1 Tax=Mesorhizobium sp. M0254 TaxID=2956927 RepID=UPI0033394677